MAAFKYFAFPSILHDGIETLFNIAASIELGAQCKKETHLLDED